MERGKRRLRRRGEVWHRREPHGCRFGQQVFAARFVAAGQCCWTLASCGQHGKRLYSRCGAIVAIEAAVAATLRNYSWPQTVKAAVL